MSACFPAHGGLSDVDLGDCRNFTIRHGAQHAAINIDMLPSNA
jgi:hypothetical protein